MTAPHGLSADRLRIGQLVVSVRDHTAPCSLPNLSHYPIWSYAGDVGEVTYFWSDGRFIITWKRSPTTPVSYGTEAWPGTVVPSPDAEGPKLQKVDARSTSWDDAIDRHFTGGH